MHSRSSTLPSGKNSAGMELSVKRCARVSTDGGRMRVWGFSRKQLARTTLISGEGGVR